MENNFDVSEFGTLPAGTAVYAKGKQRVREILDTASQILAFEGYSNFTMRSIANRTGISLRNLQYYFQTKEILFQAVVEKMLEEDLDGINNLLKKKGLSPKKKFFEFIQYSIDINQSPLFKGFQFELWSLATRGSFAANCRDRMTTAYCEFIYELIKPLTGNLTITKRREKAALLLAMLQGIPLITGNDINIQFKTGKLEKDLNKIALDFIRT